jgi:hypothetical protein
MIRQTVTLAQPKIERPCRFRAEWGATLLSAFSEAAHVGTRPHHHVPAVQLDRLEILTVQTTLPWLDRALAGLGIYVYLRPLVVAWCMEWQAQGQ